VARLPPLVRSNHCRMVALFVLDAKLVALFESNDLTSFDKLLLTHDLVRVVIASCSSEADSSVIDVNDHGMLSHQRASKHYLVPVLNVGSHAILSIMLSVHILTGEPIVGVHLGRPSFTLRPLLLHQEAKNGQRFKEL